MEKNWFRKGLVVGIIILFIGVGVSPTFAISMKTSSYSSISISENENLDNDLIKIPIQIHEPDDIKSYTMTVTKLQRDELDAFVNTFKQELDKAKTYEEIITIYNDAIVTLDEIGLIPKDISIEQLQNLITRYVQLSYRNHINKNAYGVTYDNLFCMIAGYSQETYTPSYFDDYGFWIAYGMWNDKEVEYYPAYGWICSIGMYGKWIYNGGFHGTLDIYSWVFFLDYYIGTKGFLGLYLEGFDDFYIGSALKVGIGTSKPSL
jgi:hypothetical protein